MLQIIWNIMLIPYFPIKKRILEYANWLVGQAVAFLVSHNWVLTSISLGKFNCIEKIDRVGSFLNEDLSFNFRP